MRSSQGLGGKEGEGRIFSFNLHNKACLLKALQFTILILLILYRRYLTIRETD